LNCKYQKVYIYLIYKNIYTMKSILLKIDEKLLKETEKHVKQLKTSRNSYIKIALEAYNKVLQRKEIEDQLRKEVAMIKKDKKGLEEFKEWEEASLVDLNSYLDKLESEES
jgi:hypothetical protein